MLLHILIRKKKALFGCVLCTPLLLYVYMSQVIYTESHVDRHDLNLDVKRDLEDIELTLDLLQAINETKLTEVFEDGFVTFDDMVKNMRSSSNDELRRSINELTQRFPVFQHHAVRMKAHRTVDCNQLVRDDLYNITNDMMYQHAKHIMETQHRNEIPIEKYLKLKTADCQVFRSERGYIMDTLSEEENNFPLAYSLLVYKNPEQIERLLRSIYRPQNTYCIHIDLSTEMNVSQALTNIAGCFDNVHLAVDRVEVEWGQMSLLEAELSCMRTVSNYTSWKYYINLAGQEFPLKTNREIVSILRTMQGANIVDGSRAKTEVKFATRYTKAGPAPHGIVPIKGDLHVMVNRDFVNFTLKDRRAKDLIHWLRNTSVPDESLFSTLNYNPQLGIRGSFLGEPEDYPLKVYFARYKNRNYGRYPYHRQCMGKYVRTICILGLGDIHKAFNGVELFANKLYLDFEYLALDCLEEQLYKKTWRQFLLNETIDVSFYKHSHFIKHKI